MIKVLIYLAKEVEPKVFLKDLMDQLKDSQTWVVKKLKKPRGVYRLRHGQGRFSDVSIDLMKFEEQGEPFNILHEEEKIAITYPGFSFPQVVALIKGSKENNEAIVCGYLTNHLLRKVKSYLNGLIIS